MDKTFLCRVSFALLWLSLAACPNQPGVQPKVIQLATGFNHSCALLDTGDIQCWGNNFVGQLGVGNQEAIGADELLAANNVALGGKALQVEAGDFFSCALLETGAVRCWGDGRDGRLGYGNEDRIGDDETPASAGDLDLGGKATQIALGSSHACALLDTGAVRCWGANGRGELGYGNLDNIGDNEAPSIAGDVNLGSLALQISAGNDSTCAIVEGGNLRCWGRSTTLGQGPAVQPNNNIGDDETPGDIADINLGGQAIQVSASLFHACALLDTGTVRCWGSNISGELGYPGVSDVGRSNTPADQGDIDLGGKAVRIETGLRHSCALLDTGEVKCWGEAEQGQLGLGNANNIGLDNAPSAVGSINLGGQVIQLSSGNSHNCALLADDVVRCWGSNDSEQLGIGDPNHIGDDETPASAANVEIDGTVSQLATGDVYSCVILDNGAVRCWGDNELGQNGYGLQTDIGDDELPASVGDLPLGGKAVQLSVRDAQACALLDTGGVRCWGSNANGFLGYGDVGIIGDDETPADLGDLDLGGAATQVALGGSHACVLLDTGAVRCWGANFEGELGYGNTETIGDDEAPGAGGDVDLGGNAIQLVAGVGFTCALLDTGAVRCWGTNFNGELGYGNTNLIGDDETPATAGDIDLGGIAVQLTAGDSYTCAILETGAIRCWGGGGFGALGYGNTNNIGDDETPASAGDVPVGGKVTQVSAQAFTTCALLDTGAARCWGFNIFGSLGYGLEGNQLIGDDETPADLGDIDLGGNAVQVSTGVVHTCALLDTGGVKCWGSNSDGELGYGNDSDLGDSDREIPADSAVKLF
jgi:alpha-tubulin suppressor-like RCC1 family protein